MTQEELLLLADPWWSLQRFAVIQDQATGGEMLYDPYRLTQLGQSTILDYIRNPPRVSLDAEAGTTQTLWANFLKGRQSGFSVTTEAGFYPKAAYNAAWKHLTVADHDERANMLHDAAQKIHTNWEESVRMATSQHLETRKISFTHGGFMRTASGRANAMGIGRSIDSFHGSENGFWKDWGGSWSLIQPALINRDNSLVVNECTPVPLSAPSAASWRDTYELGKARKGRWVSFFFPFWDTKLCVRGFGKGEKLTNEEIGLLDRYAAAGLTPENLMFRRFVMDTDPEIRRNPALFDTYYPFNDVDCWGEAGEASIREDHFAKRDHKLVEPNGKDYQEYNPPKPGAVYVLGVDAAGFGKDHSAFVVLEVWADHTETVAEFGGNIDPAEFNVLVEQTGRRYNQAYVAVERNGVGLAAITHLMNSRYPNLIVHSDRNPGIPKTSHEQVVFAVVDSLLDNLVVRSQTLKRQCLTYRGDKEVEQSTRSLLLGVGGGGRRERAHWDRFSALAMACLGARSGQLPVRYRPREAPAPSNVLPFGVMSYNQSERLRKLQQPTKPKRKKFRRRK